MRSRRRDKFDTGNGLVRSSSRKPHPFHANSQTYWPRPGLARRIGLRFRCGQQERPLSDFAAGAGKHCSGRSEHHRRRGPHPPRLLEARHRRTSCSFCCGACHRCRCSARMLRLNGASRRVLQTDAAQARSLGRHFIVGYSSFSEVAVLAEKGLISGVYITRHNVVGSIGGASERRDLGAAGKAARAPACHP